jgi:hypothetical protein
VKEIITALNGAYKECGYVQKQGTKGLNYKFAGEAAFIEALRPVLIEHGIVVFQSGVEVVSTEGYKTSGGSSMNRIIAKFEFTFAHTSGEFIKVTALGEGADVGDKTAPKCNTGALKYALRQTLLIETGDDPDATASDEQQRAETPKKLSPNDDKARAALAFAKGCASVYQGIIEPEERDDYIKANWPKMEACLKYPEAKKVLVDAGLVDNQ